MIYFPLYIFLDPKVLVKKKKKLSHKYGLLARTIKNKQQKVTAAYSFVTFCYLLRLLQLLHLISPPGKIETGVEFFSFTS